MTNVHLMFGESSNGIPVNGGTNYFVRANNGNLYVIYADSLADVEYKVSTDNGLSWSFPERVYQGTVHQLAIWYGRWSDRTDDKIYIVYSDTANDDILFRTLDTSTNTLGTQTTVFLGATTASTGCLSIIVAKGGNIVVAGYIDAGAEGGTWKSTDGGATWGATIANAMEGVGGDIILLAPDYNADTQDVCMFFWDDTADEISVKRYDDSANTWTETSISTGMVDVAVGTSAFHFAFVPDWANSRNILIAWNGIDTANQDLKCWHVSNTAITAQTDVITNAVDDCHLAALSLATDTGRLYAFWAGNPDGSEAVAVTLNVWFKYSDDYGTTWSAAEQLTQSTNRIRYMSAAPLYTNVQGCWPVMYTTLSPWNTFEYFTLKRVYTKPTGQIIMG